MYLTAGQTDVGRFRSQNQDVFASEPIGGLGLVAVVCDGMGGAKAGDVASARTRDVILGTLRDQSLRDGKTSIGGLLRTALERANELVYTMAQQDEDMRGMGTTAVVAVIRDGSACIANVGDSRAYWIGSGIRQITRDHSVVQLLVEHGQLTPEEALVHPKRHIITRAIGAEPTVEAELFDLPLEGGALLLCTDGLSGVVPPEAIASVVREDPVRAPGELIRMALEMGSTDNVTALVVYEENKEAANG